MPGIIAQPFLLAKSGLVIGVDEAGRGPLAGPVVAAACVLGPQVPAGLDDSKKLSAKRRAVLEPLIQHSCRWALGIVEAEEIDRINIFAATMLAMTRAVETLVRALGANPDEVLIDGNMTPRGRVAEWRWNARAVVGGDGLEPCISAASILAKEHRDRLMRAAAKSTRTTGGSATWAMVRRSTLRRCNATAPPRFTAAALRRWRSAHWFPDRTGEKRSPQSPCRHTTRC